MDEEWQRLVGRYARLVWAVARSHRLTDQEAADVSQTTWLKLAERRGELTLPHRVQAWLVTTARRESLRALAARRRERCLDLETLGRVAHLDRFRAPDPADLVIAGDRAGRLWRAFARMPLRCRQLLWIAAYAPDLSYVRVAELLGMPVGSIGPTRGRCLAALRRRLVGELGAAG
ncbi:MULTISPECIES: RNA polymerase sigma factor [unclassified Crossiella]|uniref:RNA polymerase sigma factor n=1 Tax=unclassified Crossiella TaxID=2620835 RepID=UPI001FFFEE28|nr:MULTISPECIES: sigma-70 family RNA polymerase sigma factor [unclassified Crossiella]MCK2236657.1 sigma-70 family RNA polymerase sigma factor [Crossiella sp. S99.2]MCK2250325.1 sigma-70 family RNA polymerase sigma factor [Crossiella sp. S99.1]